MYRVISNFINKHLKINKKKTQNSCYYDLLEKNKVKAIKDLGMSLHDYRM